MVNANVNEELEARSMFLKSNKKRKFQSMVIKMALPFFFKLFIFKNISSRHVSLGQKLQF